MTAADQPDDRLTRLREKLAKEPRNSPEEVAAFAAERAAMEGTFLESAMMMENGDIAVKTWEYKDGSVGDGWFTVTANEQGYEECRKRHGLTKPGDSNTIKQKWIDGKWVEQASA